ncbi:MAG: cytochrome C oxidase subunit IV family protein [Deltaproteobacteria bacterium]|nr:cytochrome C oxidase subunit IV family protein [Deltaproteobacteria bacterium]
MSTHVASVRLLLTIFVMLLALTATTVAVAYFDFGRVNIVVALSIAAFKSALVVLYFMHVRYGSRLTWVFAGAGFLWLVLLLVFTFGDYLSRPWESVTAW